MKISENLSKATQQLKTSEIPNPRFEAEILLVFVLGKTREYLITHTDESVSFWQEFRYKQYIKQRKKGYSVAAITGSKDFFGLSFKVNKHVLIPRPETEIMVESTIKISREIKNASILDVGTGSGCIITAVAKNINNDNFFFIATDISSKAINIAYKNFKLHKLNKKIKLYKSNLLKSIPGKEKLAQDNIILLANLPYLTPKQVNESPTIQKEPRLALVAGYDGLNYYQTLFIEFKNIIKDSEKRHFILCEIDPSQSQNIIQLAKTYLPKHTYEIKKDLAKRDRVFVVSIN